jgi:TonB family protein
MTTAFANPYDLNLKRFLWYSVALHGALIVAAIVSAFFHWHGNEWAGVGGEQGGVQVKLVSSAGIPMPRPTLPTDSQTVDPTQGLYKVEPPKVEQPPPPDTTKLPTFKKDKPLPPSPKSKVFENKTPPPDNAVPYGKGGNPNLPTGYSQNPGASSGVTIQGQGGGDFASRYGWYIEAVKRRIYGNWQQWSLDSAARSSRTIHCAVTFTINRDGSIKDVRVSETSGNSSYDTSAIRAVLSSTPVGNLPGDYSGSYIVAIIDFNPPGIQ